MATTPATNSSNLGLNMFLSAFGRQPESQQEVDFINNYNTSTTNPTTTSDPTSAINYPATAVDDKLNQVSQARQDFSTPNVFLSFLKTGLNAKLQPQEEQLGTSPLFEQAGLTGMPTLMDSLNARQNQIIKQDNDYAVFFEPPSMDGRIVNQYALCSFLSDPYMNFDVWLEKMRNETGNSELFSKIRIPKELKWKLRNFLDQSNITERVLFPGLDGLAQWLTRHYSPPPEAEKIRQETLNWL